MNTVVRYQVGHDSSVLVEVGEDTYGVEEVSRPSDGIAQAGQRLKSALASVYDAAQATLESLSKLSPETVEVEFGIKLAGGGWGTDCEDVRGGPLYGAAVVVS